eukprot:TRINITY_DN1273_c0_g1_i1.p1 TRINITY_DN1273_c0_g1~~TRINITY_DN1273_c0_g1_i1.p1  ORF type:complete len:1282 (+),score=171.25 TRINITY_DN1273_c0_g1_i1:4387-8232(+)
MENKEENKKEGQNLYKKGKEAFNRNAYKEAAEYLEESAQILNDKFSFFYLGECHASLKQHQKAIECYDKAYGLLDQDKPGNEHTLVLKCKAEAERHLGNYEKSIACYDMALGLAQNYMNTSDLRNFKFEIEDSKQEVKRLMANMEKRKYIEAFKQAEEMEKRKSYKEALELYTKCLTLQETAEVHYQKAQCYRAMGMFAEAIEEYSKCIELKKNSLRSDDSLYVKSLFHQGICYLEMSEFKKAVLMMRKTYDKLHFGDKMKEEVERWHKLAHERMGVLLFISNNSSQQLHETIKTKSPAEEIRKEEEFLLEKKQAYHILENLSQYEVFLSANIKQEREEVWYIVSMKWFKAWKSYMETAANDTIVVEPKEASSVEPTPSQRTGYPGPIYNDDIILFETTLSDPEDTKGFTKYPLKPGLKEGMDFTLVPSDLWELWAKVYGGLELPRRAYSTPDSMKPIVEIYLQRIPLVFKPSYKWAPPGLQILYVGRREPASVVTEKSKRICAKLLAEKVSTASIKDVNFRLWKMSVHDLDELDNSIRKCKQMGKKSVGIEGTLIDETKLVEELAIGETTAVLVELWIAGQEPIFKERKVTRPRMDSELDGTKESDWKKYLTIEGNKFTKIPLRIIASPSTTRCGRTGLENLGNTCYMNSGLQCLSNCQELTKYFLLGLYKDDINKENPLGQKGYLAETYADLLNDMWRGNYRAVSAYDLKRRIVVNASQFRGYAQQDSQELILYMLDGLHEDLNRVKRKPYVEMKDYENISDEELSAKRWTEHLMRNQSMIVDMFCGQLKSRLVCPSCNKHSIAFDPFMVLSVPIPQVNYLGVTFVPLNMARDPLRVKMTVTDGTPISEVHRRLLKQIELPEATRLFYAIVQKGRIWQRLSFDSTCSEALRDGELYAYEYQLPSSETADLSQYYFLEVDCQYVASGIWSEKKALLNYPLMFAVPLSSSFIELKLQILERFQPFLKETPVSPATDRLKALYEAHFLKTEAKAAPYTLEIVNNRAKTSRYILSSKYEECEFCQGKAHSEDCPFSFKDEDKLTLKDALSLLKGKRQLVLGLVFNHKSEIIRLEQIKAFFDSVRSVYKSDNSPESHRGKISLYDCLECFSTEEQLDQNNMWFCPKCKKHVQAKKKMDLYKLPTILIIHLKRFKNKQLSIWGSHKKIDDFIDYQMTGLDLKKYTLASPEVAGGCVYDLFAVSNHFGGLSGGHYTATCYNSAVNKWLYFNDSSVYNAGEEDVVSSAGYVLFYRRVDSSQWPASNQTNLLTYILVRIIGASIVVLY